MHEMFISINEFKRYIMNEENDLSDGVENEVEDAKAYPAILFSDVIGSSKLWSKDSDKMEKYLDKHFKIMSKIVDKYDAFIVKTIGDAFMVYFKDADDSLLSAINTAIEMLDKNELRLRIGISYGKLYEKTQEIQGYDIKDYFGNTVNIASRMESKVSPEDGFAFAILKPIKPKISEEITKITKKLNLEKIKYTGKCNLPKDKPKRKKSSRLLTDVQYFKCGDVEELNGINELTVFSCKP